MMLANEFGKTIYEFEKDKVEEGQWTDEVAMSYVATGEFVDPEGHKIVVVEPRTGYQFNLSADDFGVFEKYMWDGTDCLNRILSGIEKKRK